MFQIFKKYIIYSSILAFTGLFILILGLKNGDLSLLSILVILLSLVLITLYTFKEGFTKDEFKFKEFEKELDLKRAKILLEVGNLCSWQYSVNGGILKFDTSSNNFLNRCKLYYTYEELIRNSDIKRILNNVIDHGIRSINDEIYFPYLKKWFTIRGKCVDSDNLIIPNKFVGIIIDNTEHHETLCKMEKLSVTDELTGLKNRRFFFESLQSKLSLAKRENFKFSIAMIDLDYFKSINDTYGHIAGDVLLKEFAGFLCADVRPYDLVARIGGEEFVILFNNIDKYEAEKIVTRIRQRVSNSILTFEKSIINYTFSCGIGDSSELGLYTENEFISIIDSRLYEAKDAGRNLVILGG